MGLDALAHALWFAGVLPPLKKQSPSEQHQAHPEGSVALHRCHRRQRDGSEKKRRGQKKGLRTLRPPGLPFIAQIVRYEQLRDLRSAINGLKGPWGTI